MQTGFYCVVVYDQSRVPPARPCSHRKRASSIGRERFEVFGGASRYFLIFSSFEVLGKCWVSELSALSGMARMVGQATHDQRRSRKRQECAAWNNRFTRKRAALEELVMPRRSFWSEGSPLTPSLFSKFMQVSSLFTFTPG